MKLLRETVRKIILEMAMKQGDDIPSGYFFAAADGIDAAYGFPQIGLCTADGYTSEFEGYKVECFFVDKSSADKDVLDELGYRSFDLRRLDSEPSGFGPLVTEIAIEWVTLRGGVLFPDRREMSDSAQSMWDKFSGRDGFEEFIHPNLGVKGYRRKGPPVTMHSLEAKNQLFRYRNPKNVDRDKADYTRLSKDYEK